MHVKSELCLPELDRDRPRKERRFFFGLPSFGVGGRDCDRKPRDRRRIE